MKKETTVAVSMGIIFGLIVAMVMMLKIKRDETQKTKSLTNITITPTIVPNQQALSLEITDPSDGVIINTNTITIKGKAAQDSLIVIQSPIKDIVMKNTQTTFSIDFPLSFGENVIKVTAYPKDQTVRSQERELRVYNLDEQ